MKKLILNEKDYLEKVNGGWMGKNIGGTLGGPVEGKMEVLDLKFYPNLTQVPLPNDDLDLQLVWLHALEQYGARLDAARLGQEWVDHVFFPYDEYGYALTNLRRGIAPPVSGWFNNPFTNCMGSPIRSEIWAMVAPGAPGLAAYYAYQDAIVDHAGGEGVYGEMFFAAIESAAFVLKEKDRLLDIGLSFIPAKSRTYQAVRDLREWHKEGKSWLEARELVLKYHGRDNFTDAPQNIAFTILGWLYGSDFEDAILKAVNCGYDTDCTAATLGAILGIIGGRSSLPESWIEPIGTVVSVSPPVKGFDAPKDLEELSIRTLRAAKEVLAAWDMPVEIREDEETRIPEQWILGGRHGEDSNLPELHEKTFTTNTYHLPRGAFHKAGLELTLDYGSDGPCIAREAKKELSIKITNHAQIPWRGTLEIDVPQGWRKPKENPLEIPAGQSRECRVEIQGGDEAEPYYRLGLILNRFHDGTLWSTERVEFTLVEALHWRIQGPGMQEEVDIWCPGNRIAFERGMDTSKEGVYKAETLLYNPADRKVMLIAATSSPVCMELDGDVILENKEKVPFMPAYHRAGERRSAVVELSKGWHKLKVEVTKGKESLEVYVLPVATYHTEEPGPCYYYTDILFT